MGTSFVIFLDN